MAIADLTSYKARLLAPDQIVSWTKTGMTLASAGRGTWSTWTQSPNTGSAPTTAAVPDRTTTGALVDVNSFFNGGAGNLRILRQIIATSQNALGFLILYDRLSHQGGLSGIVTGAQTTNLPTAALTRYTTGDGVWACLEIYTALGTTTATTATISYTNQAGTSGQTSQPVATGATGSVEAHRLLPMNLAQGDTGVRAVASVTLAASTGTAGNFGVTLIKPLLMIPCVATLNVEIDSLLGMCCQFPEIVDNACLGLLYWNGNGNGSSGAIVGETYLSET